MKVALERGSNRNQHKGETKMKKYIRVEMDRLSPTTDKSKQYWRAQARKIFASRPDIMVVYVADLKTDLATAEPVVVARGGDHTGPGIAAIVASSGGKWGKSRQNFLPRTDPNRA
jgi:hypothetical protein